LKKKCFSKSTDTQNLLESESGCFQAYGEYFSD